MRCLHTTVNDASDQDQAGHEMSALWMSVENMPSSPFTINLIVKRKKKKKCFKGMLWCLLSLSSGYQDPTKNVIIF